MIHWVAVAALIFAFSYEKPAEAAQSSVSVLYGDGYVGADSSRHTVRLDTMAVKEWGMVYGRVDVSDFDDGDSSVFTRGIAHYGRGLHLAGQLQNQRGISQNSIGIGYSSFGKEVSWFADVYKMSSNYYGDSTHTFIYGSRDYADWQVSGFVEYVAPTKAGVADVTLAQVGLLYKVREFRVGFEQQRYVNKFGVTGLDEVVNQGVVKWNF